MRSFHLGPADPLLIRLDPSIEFVCTVWPSTQVDLSDLALTKSYLNLNGVKIDSNLTGAVLTRPDPARRFKAENIHVELVNQAVIENSQEIELVESFLRETYLNKYIIDGQSMFLNYMGQSLLFKVIRVESKNDSIEERLENTLKLNEQTRMVYRVETSTRISLSRREDQKRQESTITSSTKIGFKEVSGLDREIQLLKEFFVFPFEFADTYRKIGVDISKGVILYGLSGCGKTMLAQAICNESPCNVVRLNTSEVYSR